MAQNSPNGPVALTSVIVKRAAHSFSVENEVIFHLIVSIFIFDVIVDVIPPLPIPMAFG